MGKNTLKSLRLIFDKLIEKYHNFLTWQQVVKCQECGKVIGVCGVSYGHESDLDDTCTIHGQDKKDC